MSCADGGVIITLEDMPSCLPAFINLAQLKNLKKVQKVLLGRMMIMMSVVKLNLILVKLNLILVPVQEIILKILFCRLAMLL